MCDRDEALREHLVNAEYQIAVALSYLEKSFQGERVTYLRAAHFSVKKALTLINQPQEKETA